MSDEHATALDGPETFLESRDSGGRVAPRAGTETDHRPNWEDLHRRVQERLEELREKVARRRPTASRPGRVSTENLPLFSYRTFYRHRFDEYDAVIVGVYIQRDGEGYKLIADVGGEESGVTYAEFAGDALAVATSGELDAEVDRLLAEIASADDVVCEALEMPAEEPLS